MAKRKIKKTIFDLSQLIAKFENTADGYANNLRLDLSEIVLRHLNEHTMTQDNLAKKAKIKPQMITRIVHAASNCTFATAGKILFALGVKVKLAEQYEIIIGNPSFNFGSNMTTVAELPSFLNGANTDAQERYQTIR